MAKGKLLDFDPERQPEMILLNEFRHEITNFRPGFISKKAPTTFFLSPAGSDWFEYGINSSTPVTYVSYEIFKMLCFMDLLNVTIIKKSNLIGKDDFDPAIYLIFKIGDREKKLYGALRIKTTEKRSHIISKCEKMAFSAIDASGEIMGREDGRTYFELPIIVEAVNSIDKTSWESHNFEQKRKIQ